MCLDAHGSERAENRAAKKRLDVHAATRSTCWETHKRTKEDTTRTNVKTNDEGQTNEVVGLDGQY